VCCFFLVVVLVDDNGVMSGFSDLDFDLVDFFGLCVVDELCWCGFGC